MYRHILISCAFILFAPSAFGQHVEVLPQHDMGRWGIPAGNYSGITSLTGGRYALVSDKAEGWTEVHIDFSEKGDVQRMTFLGQHPTNSRTGGRQPLNARSLRDSEGIVSTAEGTLFVSAENDQRIIELDTLGVPTGRELAVPEHFGVHNIYGNYGFEALAYNPRNGHFWTTTEQALRSDSEAQTNIGHPVPTRHRLLEFGEDLLPVAEYPYCTETPAIADLSNIPAYRPAAYAFGVPEMTVLNDTTLLVLEREFFVRRGFNRSYVHCRLFKFQPNTNTKSLVTEFRTTLRIPGRKDLANYEGMCLGPLLPNGRRTLLLVADSQNRQGNRLFRLKDYIRVIVFDD